MCWGTIRKLLAHAHAWWLLCGCGHAGQAAERVYQESAGAERTARRIHHLGDSVTSVSRRQSLITIHMSTCRYIQHMQHKTITSISHHKNDLPSKKLVVHPSSFCFRNFYTIMWPECQLLHHFGIISKILIEKNIYKSQKTHTQPFSRCSICSGRTVEFVLMLILVTKGYLLWHLHVFLPCV